jgi:molybdopterin synthase sulfur carrier subunit
MIRVLLFGPVAERAGIRALQAEFRQGMSLQSLQDELTVQYPQAFAMVCFSAVNGEQVRDKLYPLADNSEVAFMAKFSGG